MTTATKKGTKGDIQPVSSQAILEQYGQMLLAVPMADDDDGSGIIAGILQANRPEDLNQQSQLPKAEDYLGTMIKVERIERRESSLEDNTMGYYLVVRGVTADQHQAPVVFGTGSVGITAVLVKLWAHGWLPAVVEVRRSDKETKAGRRPLNLYVHGANAA